MSTAKAQFQINNGNGWQTIAEADITNGIVNPPNAWTMARVMQKQIVYVGYTPVKTTVAPSDNTPRDTHFSGFAHAFWGELLNANNSNYIDVNVYDDPTDPPNYIEVIARRAYDLVYHALYCSGIDSSFHNSASDMYKREIATMINTIPDLPVLPEVEES